MVLPNMHIKNVFQPILLIILIVLIKTPNSFSADNEKYLACTTSYQCVDKNISYPFWGGDRPEYCGYPGFELDCSKDAPEFTMVDTVYRVLDIGIATQNLTQTRLDYWNDYCPTYLRNSTLDFNLFNYTSSTNITIFYDCPTIPPELAVTGLSSSFSCNINGSNIKGYFVTDSSALDQAGSSLWQCGYEVLVPVFESAADSISDNATSDSLIAAINGGFGSVWKLNQSTCETCTASGGACGQDSAHVFVCYCFDGAYISNCTGIRANIGQQFSAAAAISGPSTTISAVHTHQTQTFHPLYLRHVSPPPAATPPSSMHPLLLLLSLLHVTVSASPCGVSTFSCGPFPNLTYPFSSTESPCGPAEFTLGCTPDYAEFTIDSLSYRVLDVFPSNNTLVLSRADLYNTTCTSNFSNSTSTNSSYLSIDFSISNEPLTLFYDCSTNSYFPGNRSANNFTCHVAGKNRTQAHYLTGAVPSDPVLKLVDCGIDVTVPIAVYVAEELKNNETSLNDALMKGFSVNYTVPYEKKCHTCIQNGATCGVDVDTGKFNCFCGNITCQFSGDEKSKTGLTVGLAVAGAAVVGIFIGFLFLCVRRRRRLSVANSIKKDLLAPPSSKTMLTRTADFSRKITTLPNNKIDLEVASMYFGTQIFDYAELEEATDNFSKELGEGGFGIVHYGKLNDGRVVAVKRLYEQNFRTAEQFVNEVQLLSRMRHKNLVALYGCTSRKSQRLILVYEYIPNGTVADHIHNKSSSSCFLAWPVRLNIAIETADALAYLHASEIIHRDVKTNNILLDNDFCVKVADFGLSRLFPTNVTHVSTAPQGTPGYVDPEYYQCYQLTTKSDVYSFGVVLMELLSSKEAIDTTRNRQDINLSNMAITKIQNGTLHEFVDPLLGFETDRSVRWMATRVAELGFRCLQQDKDMRPTMQEALETLMKIQIEGQISAKTEVVDTEAGEVLDLKNIPIPISPSSVGTTQWTSFCTTPTISSA